MLARRIGLDKSIAYSSGARIVQAFAGLFSIFFIAQFLSKEEQGYYYTFGSILAIQVFFELGLTSIITQFVAHEAAHLNIEDKQVTGEPLYMSRLASLLQFCIKWYVVLSIVLLIVLTIAGVVFFAYYNDKSIDVEWKLPWLLLVIGTTIKLFQSPFTSLLMGIGRIKEMSKIMFYQQIIIPLSMWTGLIFGLKLYVVGISSILSVLIWSIYVYKSSLWSLLKSIYRITVTEKVGYMSEIFPMQWRIALSWISGYFIFQLFNPVLFATEGPIVAGQMGMSLQVLNGITSLSMAWMSTKVPLYSSLIELKKYIELDSVFNKTLIQMFSICVMLVVTMLICVGILQATGIKLGNVVLGDRFLPLFAILILSSTVLLQSIVSSWAIYLRSHKQEPYLITSIVSGILCCISTLGCGKLWGLYGIIIGYFVVTLVMLFWNHYIYCIKKQEWHG